MELSNKILEMYEEGASSKEIEKALDVNYQKVVKVLSNFGIDYKVEYTNKQTEKYENALELYNSGMQFKKICKDLGIGPNSLRPYLKDKGVQWRSQVDSLNLNRDISEEAIVKRGDSTRKYEIDQTVFKDLTREDVAYWIGFLYADGTIGKGKEGNYRIAIGLAECDKLHLEKFCRFLKTPIERVKYFISTKSYQVTVSSYLLWKSLRDLGFTNRKSWEGKPPIELIDNRHFWRGVIDGDGSLSLTEERGRIRFYTSICGTEDICFEFKYFISGELSKNFQQKLYKRDDGISEFRVSANSDVVDICELLYKDSTIYLERKYQKYLQFKEYFNKET